MVAHSLQSFGASNDGADIVVGQSHESPLRSAAQRSWNDIVRDRRGE
jgi:hypothetical protein